MEENLSLMLFFDYIDSWHGPFARTSSISRELIVNMERAQTYWAMIAR
jgi:hypothetical protein